MKHTLWIINKPSYGKILWRIPWHADVKHSIQNLILLYCLLHQWEHFLAATAGEKNWRKKLTFNCHLDLNLRSPASEQHTWYSPWKSVTSYSHRLTNLQWHWHEINTLHAKEKHWNSLKNKNMWLALHAVSNGTIPQ